MAHLKCHHILISVNAILNFAAIICDKLPSLKHGRIRHSNGYRWNSVASYRCDWDYSFKKDHGDVRRVCEDDGSWSGSPPLCFRKFILFSSRILLSITSCFNLYYRHSRLEIFWAIVSHFSLYSRLKMFY